MKRSIKRQFAAIFIGLMFGTILICFIINTFCLEKYYISEKKEAIHDAYESVKAAARDGNLEKQEYASELNRICTKYNLSMMVMDMNSKVTICVGAEKEFMQAALYEEIFRRDSRIDNIENYSNEDGTEYYVLQNVPDSRSNLNYLQMYGMFDQDHFFMLRCSLESIKESVATANRFFAFTGLAAAFLGGLIIYFTTSKITGPIKELSEISERMTNLDFEAKYNGHNRNEISNLGENINKLSEKLEVTINELQAANEELKKDIAQKEKIDEMRKEFLSNVTHELKTPIALVRGYAEGLKDNVNEDAASRDMYCDVIIDEASKMNDMVKKLLNLNEIENGENILDPVKFDVVELIKNYIEKNDVLAKQNDISISFKDDEKIDVYADEFMVEEVFANYFSNAIHYAKGEKRINIKCISNGNKVRVSVINSGDPIPSESLEHIWEKFYKVDKARTREYGGSGVGLSIVKAIMDAMNEQYGVVNYDNGVEFWFEIDALKGNVIEGSN